MDDLSSVDSMNPQSGEAGNGGALMCDNCELSESAAVFCVTCQRALCSHHKKEDQEKAVLIGHPVHFHVKVAHFLSKKQAYIRGFCKQHTYKEISLACRECRQAFCPLCNTEQDCPSSDGVHAISSLAAVAKAVQEKIKDFESSLTGKSARLLELARDALETGKCVQESLDTKIANVEKQAAEQIEMIERQGEQIKQDIAKHLEDTQTEADKFLKTANHCNMEALDQLSGLQIITQLTSPTLILEKFALVEGKVKAVLNIDLKPFTVPTEVLPCTNVTGIGKKLEVDLDYVSPKLKFIRETMTKRDLINSVKWITRDLMVTCGRNATIINSKLRVIRSIPLAGAIDVIQHEGRLLFLQKSPDYTKTIQIYSMHLEKIRDFATLPSKSSELSKIAEVGNKIVASDPPNKCLYIWDSHGNPLPILDLSPMRSPRGVFTTADGAVLVSDYSTNGSVCKCNISPPYSVEWVSDELDRPWGIAVTDVGLIFVNNNKPRDKAIYQLSSEGNLLAKFTCNQLNCLELNDITILNGKLVAACRRSGLKLFQLTF